MIKIGDFSKLARTSVRMLYHYEKLGLLLPKSVDSQNGYRYYDEKQLIDIYNIVLLKNMGFSLAKIKELLFLSNDKETIKEELLIQKEIAIKEKDAILHRLEIINDTLNKISEDKKIMEYAIILKEIPKRKVISVRQIIKSYQDEGFLWDIMSKEIKNQNVKISSPCNSLAIFHDKEYRDSDVDIEVQMSVEGDYNNTDVVIFKDVEAFEIVSTIFKGSYTQFPKAYEAIISWINNNNYEIVNSSFSINHVSPGQDCNEDNFVTEICFPVKKK